MLATAAIVIHAYAWMVVPVPWPAETLGAMSVMDLSGALWIAAGLDYARRRAWRGVAFMIVAWVLTGASMWILGLGRP